jgi:hypothetical protein
MTPAANTSGGPSLGGVRLVRAAQTEMLPRQAGGVNSRGFCGSVAGSRPGEGQRALCAIQRPEYNGPGARICRAPGVLQAERLHKGWYGHKGCWTHTALDTGGIPP